MNFRSKNKIETIGLPGAGKTTFLRENCKYSSLFSEKRTIKLGIFTKITLRISILSLVFGFLLKNPNFFRHILKNKKPFWLFRKLAYRKLMMKFYDPERPQLEGGLIQPILTDAVEHAYHENHQFYDLILNLVELPDIILFFTNKVDICQSRYMLRGDLEPRELSKSQIQSLKKENFEFGAKVLQTIKTKATKMKVEIIEIDLDKMGKCE